MSRTYVDVSTPYAGSPGRLSTELSFGASERRRALEHRAAANELTRFYGVEYRTPWRLTPNWTPYKEMADGTPFGQLDERRLTVWGPERAVARYLAALPRVLAGLEAAATRAARAFGQWRRSLLAALSGHLEYEDPTTLRVRAREFRTDVLRHLVTYMMTPPAGEGGRDRTRPLWDQAAAVAAEVWTTAPVDPWDAPEDEVEAVMGTAVLNVEPVVIEPDTQLADETPGTVAELLSLAGPESNAPRERLAAVEPLTHEPLTHEATAARIEARAELAEQPLARQTGAAPVTWSTGARMPRRNPRIARRRSSYGSISTRGPLRFEARRRPLGRVRRSSAPPDGPHPRTSTSRKAHRL
ncbi:hypothetical protein ABTY59_33595 [Streptomyces sp. NPDC096079]|uniref:hypothetical protein n=1 Tax=Streptomyces sp. NPDC096079 TaxID=3155820 RepID=UPI0033178CAF